MGRTEHRRRGRRAGRRQRSRGDRSPPGKARTLPQTLEAPPEEETGLFVRSRLPQQPSLLPPSVRGLRAEGALALCRGRGVHAGVHVRTYHRQELWGQHHHVPELRGECHRQDAQRRTLQRVGVPDAGVSRGHLTGHRPAGRPDDRRPRGLHLHQPHHQPDRDQGGRLLHQLVLLSLGQAAVDALGKDHGAGLPRRDMPGIPQAVHRRLPGQRHLAGHRR